MTFHVIDNNLQGFQHHPCTVFIATTVVFLGFTCHVLLDVIDLHDKSRYDTSYCLIMISHTLHIQLCAHSKNRS